MNRLHAIALAAALCAAGHGQAADMAHAVPSQSTLSGAAPSNPGIKQALDGERFGLFPGEHFRASTGKCGDCPTVRQGLWYFEDDLLAVPAARQPVSGFSPTLQPMRDVRQWAALPAAPAPDYPPLIWLGSPQRIDDAALQAKGMQLSTGGSTFDLRLVPKLSTNQSYANERTTAFFEQRPLRLRGKLEQQDGKQAFVARTIWPKDFIIDAAKLKAAPLAQPGGLAAFVREAGGGAAAPYTTRLLWERTPGKTRDWQDKAVIGIMLNGAQGDDDEAFGGHFAIATGRYGAKGEFADWTVNNFYNLDSVSEKGIISATVPMDNYLMDLNSGQQYYRPSYMLVAVMNKARTAAAYQGAVQRIFNHFYRHDFTYQHAAANCAGISLDIFKALGWQIPERGPTSRLKAVAAYAYLSVKDGSLASGRKIYDYLTEEQIRLYPAVAFEAAGDDLLRLASGASGRVLTPFEKELGEDVEAIVVMRIPQVPSSRAMGSNPVFSFDEYLERTPADHSKWKIVPAGPRPFPAALRDGAALVQPAPPGVPLPIIGILVAIVAAIGTLAWRRRSGKKSA
ncbi:MAG: hypothetical protein ABIT83_17685 [Massilia sp.]